MNPVSVTLCCPEIEVPGIHLINKNSYYTKAGGEKPMPINCCTDKQIVVWPYNQQ